MHVTDQGRLDGSDRFLPTLASDDGFCPTRWRDSLLQSGLSRVSSAQLVLNGNVGGIKSVPRVAFDRFAWVYSLPSGPWDLQVNSNLTPSPEKLSLPRQSAHEWAGLVVMIYPATAGDAVTLLFQGRGHVQRAAHNAFVAFMEAYSSLTAEQRQLIPLTGCLLAGTQPHEPSTYTSTAEAKLVPSASSPTLPSPAAHLPPATRPSLADYQYFVHLQGRTVVTTIEACTAVPDGSLVTRAAAASTGLAASVLTLTYDRTGNLRVQDGDIIPDFTDLYACTGSGLKAGSASPSHPASPEHTLRRSHRERTPSKRHGAAALAVRTPQTGDKGLNTPSRPAPRTTVNVNAAGEELFAVGAIRDVKKKAGGHQFLVHWNGYAASYDSWEPATKMDASAFLLVDEFYDTNPDAMMPAATKARRALADAAPRAEALQLLSQVAQDPADDTDSQHAVEYDDSSPQQPSFDDGDSVVLRELDADPDDRFDPLDALEGGNSRPVNDLVFTPHGRIITPLTSLPLTADDCWGELLPLCIRLHVLSRPSLALAPFKRMSRSVATMWGRYLDDERDRLRQATDSFLVSGDELPLLNALISTLEIVARDLAPLMHLKRPHGEVTVTFDDNTPSYCINLGPAPVDSAPRDQHWTPDWQNLPLDGAEIGEMTRDANSAVRNAVRLLYRDRRSTATKAVIGNGAAARDIISDHIMTDMHPRRVEPQTYNAVGYDTRVVPTLFAVLPLDPGWLPGGRNSRAYAALLTTGHPLSSAWTHPHLSFGAPAFTFPLSTD